MTTALTDTPAAAAPAPAAGDPAAASPAPAAASPAAPAAASAQPGAADPNAKPAPGDAAPAGEDGQGGKEKPTSKAPEKYELAAPEGIELDATARTEFEAIAKDLDLSNEQAQKLTDIATAMRQRELAQHATMVKGWGDQSKADKEFGGDAFDQNRAVARKALDTFGSKELVELLNTSGLGNHPEIIRTFYRAGKAISEGRFIPAGGRTGTHTPEQSLASRLYPDSK
jgi:hypothetical protein